MLKRIPPPRFRPGSAVFYHETDFVVNINGTEVRTVVKSGNIAECIKNASTYSYRLTGVQHKVLSENVLMSIAEKSTWRNRLNQLVSTFAFKRKHPKN